MRAVHEHGVRLEVAQLARDAHRQREMEGEPVDEPRPDRLDEVERLVVREDQRRPRSRARAPRRRARARRTSSRFGSDERKAISGSRDEQDAQGTSPRFVSGRPGARTRAAYSSGVANHCSDPAFATNPRPDASSRFDRTLTSARASAVGVVRGKEQAVLAVDARDPRSHRRARPRPPDPGRTPRRRRGPCPRASTGARGTSRRRARRRPPPARGRDSQVTFGPRSTSMRARSSRAPAPISRSDASGHLLRDARPRVHEQVDALVELERADEQRDRVARAAERAERGTGPGP